MPNVFFSYSHEDEDFRDALEIHLSALKRQGIIGTWHDRRIGAGNEFENQIDEHLESDEIILLLVSPYFIASNYCYDIEMKKAMERHEKNDARVIPVIVHPCDWHGTPFGKLLATPTDGKPISKFPNPHEAYLEVTMSVRKAAEDMQKSQSQTEFELSDLENNEPNTVKVPDIRSSNLRIKKTFTDKDKDKFLREAFEYLAKFFEGSLTELERRNQQVEMDFCRIDAHHFTAKIYVNGTEANRCRIWLGGRNSFQEGIYYSNSDTGNDNSFNETLNVEEDGYNMLLKPLGMRIHGQHDAGSQSFEGAAEYFWGMFIEYLQG
jgi:hypothetical protein